MTALAVTSAPPHSRRRGALGWIVLCLALIGVAVVGGSLVYGGYTPRDALDPESAGPEGTRAIAQILAERGVEIVVTRDRAATERALAGGDATLVVRDAPLLTDASLSRIARAARDVVLIEPRSRSLDELMNGSGLGGFAGDERPEPACDIAAATRAGAVRVEELLRPGAGVTGCYPVGDEFALLRVDAGDGRTVTALDGRAVLTNATLRDDGNAALAAGVLGTNDRLVWYVPSLTDADEGLAAADLGDLTPPWVTPVIVLLLLAGLTAAIWRGRKFGPLVTERLPVTVRAGETTEGRGRLYAESGDAGHALDQLRRATRTRLARALGLAPHAAPTDIADAVADRLGTDRRVVRGVLIDTVPRTDTDLVQASDRLRDLETSVRAALRTERPRP